MDFRPIRRQLRNLAIANLTLYLIMGQTLFFVLGLAKQDFLDKVVFVPALVLQGEWWRIFTFLFVPPSLNPLFLFLALYFFFMIGTALENSWGVAHYNLYLLIGYLATVAAAFLFPEMPATNLFIGSSVFLAFAMLYPDFVIYLFFVLPIKVKWLALIDAVLMGFGFTFGSWQTKVLILASVLNFLLFFRREIIAHARSSRRRMKNKSASLPADRDKPFHVCAVCGITDKTHRNMDFRYCPGCGGKLAYCTEHLHNHQHRVPALKGESS